MNKEFKQIGKNNPRRASRLEGKVKNRGIKNVKKKRNKVKAKTKTGGFGKK